MSQLAPTLSLLARQPINSFGQQLLLINPPGPVAVRHLDPLGNGLAVYLDWPSYQRDAGSRQLGLTALKGQAFDQAIVFLSRQRRRTDCLIAFASHGLPVGAPIWLVGENRSGIKASGKRLLAVGERADKVDSARHCCLFATRNRERLGFHLADWAESRDYPVDGTHLTLAQLPGVFSSNGLDEGTALLLEHLPKIEGRVLDVGCGNGIISLVLKRRGGDCVDITGVDADTLAVAAAEMNAQALQLAARFQCGDLYPQEETRFDHIVTNPPFHGQGPQNDLAITEGLIREARERLNPGGQLWMVCNRFLPWRAQLAKHFTQVDTVTENRRYSILRAQRR